MPVATIDQSFTASPVPFVGGGDADVFTKKGRKTRVRIRVGNLRISGDGRTVFSTVFYEVKELRKDNTHLSYNQTAFLPVPGGKVARRILTGSTFDWTHTFEGQNHSWNDVQISNQHCIDLARCRIDGGGRDDQGNAALEIHFSFDVETN